MENSNYLNWCRSFRKINLAQDFAHHFTQKTHHYFLGVSINFVSKWKLPLARLCSWYRQNPLNPSHHRDEPRSDIEELGRLIGAGYDGLGGSWSQQIINWGCWFYEVSNLVEMIQEASFPTHPVEIMKRDSWIDGVFYCSDTIWPGNSTGAYEPSYEYRYILLQYYTYIYIQIYTEFLRNQRSKCPISRKRSWFIISPFTQLYTRKWWLPLFQVWRVREFDPNSTNSL